MLYNIKNCEGTALVIGLPWLRTGTGKVMETQIKYLRSRGLKTLFVAVPHNTTQRRSNEVWSNFSNQSPELGADKTIIATFEDRISKGGKIGRWYSARRKLNAMHWAMRAAASSRIPLELDLELKSGRVRTLLVNHIYALQFGLRVNERLKELGCLVPLILVTHDVQAHILLDNDIKNPFTRKLDSLDELLETEIEALKRADVLVHVSVEDKRFFESAIPNKPHILALPTSEDQSGVKHPFPAGGMRDLLFVGSSNIGNFHALEWFFSRVKPWLGASPPSMLILGSVDGLVKNRDHSFYDRISQHFVGSTVETLPYYLMCTSVIIPMVGGRGVSVKTVEAAAIGRPIVGTGFAYRGLPMEAVKMAGLRICDNPREFALEILDTLNQPGPKEEASRALFKQLFSYDRFEKTMNEALGAALPFYSTEKTSTNQETQFKALLNEHR